MSATAARNVEVYAGTPSNEYCVVVAGFWQHGDVTWSAFYGWLGKLLLIAEDWSVFDYGGVPGSYGDLHIPDETIIQPANYIILGTGRNHIEVGLKVLGEVRRRIPTRSDTVTTNSALTAHYRHRVRQRDQMTCRITMHSLDEERLQAVHIFPRARQEEFTRRFRSYITDTAPEKHIGGPCKIDSIQNVILLRSDLHGLWDSYKIGVNPANDYRVWVFSRRSPDLVGLRLNLDHIEDQTQRPLDVLLHDHFMQCLMKHVRGAGEEDDDNEDHDFIDDFETGCTDLSDTDRWTSAKGRELVELYFADRLFEQSYPSTEISA